jgi:hypothetical protein
MFKFVLEFVGLRGMHTAVSMLQLGAMVVVTLLRVGLRTQRLHANENDLSIPQD